MKSYIFTVYLRGDGESVEQAWRDACESFSLDSGPVPESDEYIILDEEDSGLNDEDD
jgi:hypothetical protein